MSYTYPEALTALESVLNDLARSCGARHTFPCAWFAISTPKPRPSTWTAYSARVNMPVRAADASHDPSRI